MTDLTPATRTPEEIDALKRQWKDDPCWDIEVSTGFEAHYEELRAWRIDFEAKAEERENARLLELAEKWGIPGNLALARHLDDLEYRVRQTERRIDRNDWRR